MSDFLDVLSIYYFCDAMANLRPLNPAEYLGCTDIYELVKTHFARGFDLAPRGTPERIEQMRAAYLGFLNWQDANPALVAELRGAAEARALGEAPAALR